LESRVNQNGSARTVLEVGGAPLSSAAISLCFRSKEITMSDILFSPWKLGRTEIKNRVVMAPMTRSRCPGNSPGDIVATYYSQRAEAGLNITEGTSPSPNGLGYARIPGLFAPRHVQDWRKVTDAVHGAGGRIFVQLMHTGRVSHPLNMPGGSRILAPSPIALSSKMWTDAQGEQPYPVPQEMTEEDIRMTIDEYVRSAKLAMEAGFDGVELHGANGYLINQFLNTGSNQRKDQWGGGIENRIRFAIEIARQVSAKIGGEGVGMRLSPYGVFNEMAIDPTMEDTFERLVAELNGIGIGYVHLVDHSSMGAPEVKPSIKQKIRAAFRGTLILSGGYDRTRAEIDLVAKKGDLIAFGRPFISNPRLVTKLRKRSALLPADPDTFYSPGAKGYTDYPL
jgi:N-ethylmaleimide reductase